jgi:hypothetical protein
MRATVTIPSFRGAAQRRARNPGANAPRSVTRWVPDRASRVRNDETGSTQIQELRVA